MLVCRQRQRPIWIYPGSRSQGLLNPLNPLFQANWVFQFQRTSVRPSQRRLGITTRDSNQGGLCLELTEGRLQTAVNETRDRHFLNVSPRSPLAPSAEGSLLPRPVPLFACLGYRVPRRDARRGPFCVSTRCTGLFTIYNRQNKFCCLRLRAPLKSHGAQAITHMPNDAT